MRYTFYEVFRVISLFAMACVSVKAALLAHGVSNPTAIVLLISFPALIAFLSIYLFRSYKKGGQNIVRTCLCCSAVLATAGVVIPLVKFAGVG